MLGGYRFEGTFHFIGDVPYPKIEVDNTFTFAFSLGYHFNPNEEVELNYSYATPQASASSPFAGGSTAFFDIGMHEFQAGFLVYLVDPSAPVRVYLEGLLGVTILNTFGDVGDTVKFTPGISLGVKARLTDHVGLRAEAHYTPMYLYTTGDGATLCFEDGGCWDTGARYLQQVDLRAGVTFRF